MTMPSPPPTDSQKTVEHCPTCRTELSDLKAALQEHESLLAELNEMLVAIGLAVKAEGFEPSEEA
jgi:heterodisulfide reductase subunit B